MKKLFCLVAFSALFLTSCGSSDDSSTNDESGVLLKKTIETYASDGSTVTTNYTYSGKKMVKSTDSDGYYENYTYTGDLLTKVEYYDGDDTLLQRETFSYNANGKLTTYLALDLDSDTGHKETYVYNSNGTVSTASFSGDATTQTNPVRTGVVHFTTTGEVSSFDSVEIFMGMTSTTSYTYDTKNNPFKNVIGFDKLIFIDSEATGLTHNVLTESYTSTSQDYVYTSTYTYNSLNFPLTDSEIEDTDASSVIATQFFYN